MAGPSNPCMLFARRWAARDRHCLASVCGSAISGEAEVGRGGGGGGGGTPACTDVAARARYIFEITPGDCMRLQQQPSHCASATANHHAHHGMQPHNGAGCLLPGVRGGGPPVEGLNEAGGLAQHQDAFCARVQPMCYPEGLLPPHRLREHLVLQPSVHLRSATRRRCEEASSQPLLQQDSTGRPRRDFLFRDQSSGSRKQVSCDSNLYTQRKSIPSSCSLPHIRIYGICICPPGGCSDRWSRKSSKQFRRN